MIDRFTNQHRFLSNFHPAPVTLDETLYPTVEHAYQAAKTINHCERAKIHFPYLCLRCHHRQQYEGYGCGVCGHHGVVLRLTTPGEAKRISKTFILRPNWYEIRLVVMEDLVRQKFTNHQHLRNMLLSTGEQELVEGNTWGDRFWGMCGGVGENHLGKILMKVRQELRPTPAIDTY